MLPHDAAQAAQAEDAEREAAEAAADPISEAERRRLRAAWATLTAAERDRLFGEHVAGDRLATLVLGRLRRALGDEMRRIPPASA